MNPESRIEGPLSAIRGHKKRHPKVRFVPKPFPEKKASAPVDRHRGWDGENRNGDNGSLIAKSDYRVSD